MKHLIRLLQVFTVLYIVGAVAFCYLYFIDGRNILYYKNLPFPTMQKVYHRGDIIGVLRYGCAERDIKFSVQATIVDGFALNFSPFTGTRMKGCTEKTGLELTIPAFLPPGKYHIQGITSVYVNPIQTRDVPWTTQEFEIK